MFRRRSRYACSCLVGALGSVALRDGRSQFVRHFTGALNSGTRLWIIDKISGGGDKPIAVIDGGSYIHYSNGNQPNQKS